MASSSLSREEQRRISPTAVKTVGWVERSITHQLVIPDQARTACGVGNDNSDMFNYHAANLLQASRITVCLFVVLVLIGNICSIGIYFPKGDIATKKQE